MSPRRGALLIVLVIVAAGTLMMISVLRLSDLSTNASAPVVLTFDVPEELPEIEPMFQPFAGLGRAHRTHLTVYDVVTGLDHAATDDRVRGIQLRIEDLRWGWSRISEVRDALRRFRRSGKPVVASLGGFAGSRELLLASAASQVTAPPTATIELDGLTLSALFMRGTLDKIGVTPNFAHIGQYKSAVETYTRTGFSDPARASLQALLDSDWRLLVDGLASGRRMSADSIERLINAGPYTASEAERAGLLDTLAYSAEADSLALRRGRRALRRWSFERYVDGLPDAAGGPHVALVVAAGAIVPGRSRGADLGSETLVEALREARRKSSIRAIVLRIDSPGGSSTASDDIWREVERCRSAKPVIVSMSDYAASGGYYIAVPADSIVAEPGTITGSIGVFGGKFNLIGLYRKLGFNVETLTRGTHAGMFSAYRDFTPEEANRYEGMLEETYRGFVARVSKGRHLPIATVDSIAQGRVWDAVSARRLGLVDRLGGVMDALEMARARAHLPRDETLVVERFPRVSKGFLERMIEELLNENGGDALSRIAGLPPAVQGWIAAASFPTGEALAMLPWSIEVR